MNKKQITSPCISICKTDPRTGFCYGCGRTNEEKKIWKEEKTTVVWKEENVKLLMQRMSGWQLETFKESYNSKIKTGFSLAKQSLIKNAGGFISTWKGKDAKFAGSIVASSSKILQKNILKMLKPVA